MTEVWTQWEGLVVNGIYPLRRFLNASDHSAVFLTESGTDGFLNAAIKLVPADPALTAVQLWHWKTAATFSHPHLIRLLDSGQCDIDGRPFLFVVMEYAEETLSQTLPYRALGADEVRELLVPTLDALAFLHSENWVHGQVKPSNFLVVNDHLKLASDTIRPVGVGVEKVTRLSMYDPPEAERGEVSPASDVWGLGITLVEALTQYPPTWLSGRSEPPSLPTNLPLAFVDTAQRCLSVNPADRPTVATLQAQTKPAANGLARSPPLQTAPAEVIRAPVAPAPALEIPAASNSYYPPAEEPHKRSLVTPALAALVVVFVAVWGGNRMFHRKPAAPVAAESPAAAATDTQAAAPDSQPDLTATAPTATQASPPPPSAPAPTAAPAPPPAAQNQPNTVVHEEIPRVPQSARDTITGRVKVAVRVTVDSSGKVVRDTFENPGPSRYFSRLASQAARKWTFSAAENEASREWLLRFEFGHDGTTARAVLSRHGN